MNPRKKIFLDKIKAILDNKLVLVLRLSSLNSEEAFDIKERLWSFGGNFNVVKNSIFKIAVAESKVDFLSEVAKGSIAIAYCNNDISGFIRYILEIAKKYGESKFGVLSAKYCDGNLSHDLMLEIASLPSEDYIYLKLINLLNSIPLSLVNTLNMPANLLKMYLHNYSKTMESGKE
jgi:large subunit ribosomal protein L10